jgi:uncharacterized protein (TIGR02687 family)
MNKIAQALQRMFEKNRIIFWYDTKDELRQDYESLELPDVEKIEIENNEFGVKYRILRESPKQKFLLYRGGQRPADLDNWLLDVELGSIEFRTDQSAIWLSELGLGLEFTEIVQDHVDFFKAAKRMESLKKLLKPEDTLRAVRTKMLAVCAGADGTLADILENLLAELSDEKNEKVTLIERCGLHLYLWKRLENSYGYQSETPGIRDFAIELFKSCYAMWSGNPAQLSTEALFFLKRWKNGIRQQKAFEILSKECSVILNMEKNLDNHDFLSFEELDFFELIDGKIISDLVKHVTGRTISPADRENLIRQRQLSHWYDRYRDIYLAIDYGARFIQAQEDAELNVHSTQDGISKYSTFWYLLDQLYRKFVFHAGKSGEVTMLKDLSDSVENLYSNNYLLPMNNNWQKVVDSHDDWGGAGSQRSFYKRWVAPFLKKKKKAFVIISDALRFEAGEELQRLIRQENRFEAEIKPLFSMVPSFTQLGMAALLPNNDLSFAENGNGGVLVDGKSTLGTENRSKLLNEATGGKGKAIRADDLMGMNKDACRALVREHEVVYVYHNRIDATGDKKESEERVFQAVEDTLEELVKIIKKLASANASNILVTSDHGFIYQNRPLEESDFVGGEIADSDVLYRNRRFLLGRDLTEKSSMKTFSAGNLGMKGDMGVQIPKSINRLRLKGSGSRFVHGGASLQEVIIPVIQINKKRKSDVSFVGVEILGGSTSVITAGQLSVAFYQSEPATEKVKARRLRAGIYSEKGDLISHSHDLSFDIKSENPRDREMKIRFVLTQGADKLNGQEVVLRLDEKLTDTSHYKEFKSVKYMMRRSFTSDFDL